MPSARCVVQDCSNISDVDKGISIHASPVNNLLRRKWVNFVRLHRQNFNPVEGKKFVVCSAHFGEESFQRPIHMEGSIRKLRRGAIPQIWKRDLCSTVASSRTRRKVSQTTIESKYTFSLYYLFPSVLQIS